MSRCTEQELRTKKAARETGYIAEVNLLDRRLVARREALPTVIEGERFFHERDCERLLNKTDARYAHLRVPHGLEPVVWRSWKYGAFGLWRESDLIPVAKCNKKPPEVIDLLAAVFVVNRSAKRYRNAASSCYEQAVYFSGRDKSKFHGLSRAAKQKKTRLYGLKDRGIAEAYRLGRIQYLGQSGGLSIYRGEGYCFHSELVPAGESVEASDDAPIFVEAKPKGKKEPRLKDAIHTLEQLPHDLSSWNKVALKRHARTFSC